MRKLKLGSLFDGSGGFPLAGVMNGIEPVWASEIEPFPIRVTKQRFPNMKHLGSVTDINGAEIEPVDIITFGSPCQDLSVAGKQAGIHDGERSSLFFEAVRIIKEMREHDRAIGRADVDIRPRFAVWENVPGAFSSNKGEDFKAVLQALCEIEGGNGVHVPMPSKGKWFPAGCIVGIGYSVAWRIYDAQYWGVPQRRKRIYLIADFASERAGEILFECEGVSGDHQQGKPSGEGTAEDAEGSAGRSDCIGFTNRWYASGDVTETLRAESHNALPCVAEGDDSKGNYACGGVIPWEEVLNIWRIDPECYAIDHVVTTGGNCTAQGPCWYKDICPTEKASGPHAVCYPTDTVKCLNPWDSQSIRQYDANDAWPSLQANSNGGQNRSGVCYSIEGNTVDRDTKKNGCGYCQDVSPTLNTQDKHAVTYAIEGNGQRESHKGDGYKETDAMYTLNATEQHAICMQNTGRGWWNEGDVAETLRTPCGGDATKANLVVTYGVDCRNGVLDEEKTHTIQAKPNGGFSLNCTPSVLCYEGQNICTDTDKTFTIQAGRPDDHHIQSVVYSIENHPADSRCDLMKGDKCQTLTSRMGTGGNNVPMILEIKDERK